MGISEPRDLDALRAGLTRWLRRWRPGERLSVTSIDRPVTGLSSETVFADVAPARDGGDRARRLVVRLPPHGEGLFPSYDVSAQGHLQAVLAQAGIPTVAPLAIEDDPSWVGAPFVLMPKVAGRVVRADVPYLRAGWLAEAPSDAQARLHTGVIDVLAAIHRLDWRAVGANRILGERIGDRPNMPWLAAQLDHWADYLRWAGEGTAPAIFDEGLAWCRAHLPAPEPPPSVLWGDVQLGNLLVSDDMDVAAVLDFEMASIGPAEVDVGWFLVLHDMAVARCGGDLPGFPGRVGTLDAYQSRLGRTLDDLRWYEAFAALRSGAILVRAARLLARLGVDDSWLTSHNPTVGVLEDLIAR
jgi:aminoglycoside phosphotransferase (APT) family kinase protein